MTKTKILVVEDEAIVARDLQNRLTKLGYEVVGTTGSGEEAVEKAAETGPNLVLMDILLAGDVDGIDAAKEIKARFKVPVIYVTSYSDEKTITRAKLTEPSGYVLKPFEERELKTTIEIGLHRHNAEQERKELVSGIIEELTKMKK
jgi:CheY-like chemotaxis protein